MPKILPQPRKKEEGEKCCCCCCGQSNTSLCAGNDDFDRSLSSVVVRIAAGSLVSINTIALRGSVRCSTC